MQNIASEHAVADHWQGGWDEPRLRTWAEELRSRLKSPGATLGLVFMTPGFFEQAPQILEILRLHARIQLLVGCSSGSLIVGDQELEDDGGFVLGLYHLPGAHVQAVRFDQSDVEQAETPGYWVRLTGVPADQSNGWLVFADPFQLDCETWLSSWSDAYPSVPVLGGLASGDFTAQRTQVYLNGEVFEQGGVAISFSGDVGLAGIISQGCMPIGEPWTITRAEGNVIQQIANRPAYHILFDTFNGLSKDQKKRAQGNLFVGLVIDEYQEEFHQGDFLIRNLLGADPVSGVLAVGARPRAGQSLQFQCRDAVAASEDLTLLLRRAQAALNEKRIYGACLCSCNGRGERLFGKPNHDATLVQRSLGPLGLTGFFCNGEIGPVGKHNCLHGYTASLALFVEK